MGIRPNGTIPPRGEGLPSGSVQPSGSSPGVFIMRKAVAAFRWRNTLSVLLSAIREPAGQVDDSTCQRLRCFFVLTKGMSVVGPRPALPKEVDTYTPRQKQRLLVKPGMTCYWQTRRNRDAISFAEWVELDLWRRFANAGATVAVRLSALRLHLQPTLLSIAESCISSLCLACGIV